MNNRQTEELPFECFHCGQRFGYSDSAVAFLSVVSSVDFKEPCIYCGELLQGTMYRDGMIEYEDA